jgi:VIT1/CCC1 family predicted Fe2+/Mn2+ transporter/rubrerythrin
VDKHNLATVEKMWRREVEAATTYRHLAGREPDQKRKNILLRLADQEDKHAARWSERIALATGAAPDRTEVERGLSWFQRISDQNVVLHRLEQEENRAEAEYEQLMSRLTDPADRQIAEDAMFEERDHAVVLRTLAGGPMQTPRSALDALLKRERWHVRGTGWIGSAIYGVNDGLGAVFGIVSGMAGYTGGSEVVLAAGLAGTMASALSMGAGAYLASKSEREVYESEVARERTEIEEDPHEELLELDLFYQLKGFSAEEARSMAERIQKEPQQFLRTLVHEELGLGAEESFPNPIRAMLSATVSTAIGGFIPIIPFFFTVGMPAVIASFVISTVAHFAVGAAKSLVTTRSWWASGTEMTVVGIVEAAITYGLGLAFAGSF